MRILRGALQTTCRRTVLSKKPTYMRSLAISGLLLLLTAAATGCSQSGSIPTMTPATTLFPHPTFTGVPEMVHEPPSTSTLTEDQTIAPVTMTPTAAPTATPEATLPAPPAAEPTPVPSPTPAPIFAPTSTPRPVSTPTPAPTLDQIPLPASVLAENIASLNARIVGLRFFESPIDGVARDQRVYDLSFPHSTTRFLSWELTLAFPAPGRQTDVLIDSVFLRNDGGVFAQQSTEVSINAGWTSLWHSVGTGWNDPGQWAVGLYRVELFIENEFAATAWFKVTGDAQGAIDTDSMATLSSQLAQLADRLPWTKDDLSYVEQRAFSALSRILQEGQDLASNVASLPWVLDGITSNERGALEHLALLAQQDVPLATDLAGLSWLADIVSATEWDALRSITLLGDCDLALARQLVGFPWFTDDITENERATLENFANLAQNDPALAARVSGFAWAGDGITQQESEALGYLTDLAQQDVSLGGVVAAFGWLADEIAEPELKTLANLRDLTNQNHGLGRTVSRYAWLADDITDTEWRILGTLAPIASADVPTAKTVSSFPWLADAVNDEKLQVLRDLRGISEQDPSLAQQLAGMPFLALTLEERDQHAIESIRDIAGAPEDLELLTASGWFQDGIDHQKAALITVLSRQSIIAPQEFRSLVASYDYQSSPTTLPLAGEVQLTILRLEPEETLKALGQMNRLKAAVRQIEGFMGLPFPQKDIILLYGETGIQTTGVNVGSHIVVDRPLVIQGDLRRVEAHEVSHYYWNAGVPVWFFEGASEFLTSFVISQVYGDSLRTRFTEIGGANARRCEAQSMGTLQRLIDNLAIIGYAEQSQRSYFICNYNLGEALFIDLYQTLGAASFQSTWRKIYQAGATGYEYTEAEMYQLFYNEAPTAVKEDFQQVYSLWHGGDFPG
jgi:hypothetical protein